ncbi:diacylglycerol kinase family protein [Paenibacillus sp. ACRRX]|uniref:diacylglycerol kinase family protein n=1 Tax=Paenibacillus sp. ACRRX TaxID=2918206 RepID=UPI001EF48771|nr:diacylglycerol kinase family protein [Paenibacillus sp. ACRRX]MCG7407842.1 diacylglycerol kinase family protein [Paenibacillus sp. ACRRX]
MIRSKRPWRHTFQVALEGIWYTLRTQRNMQVHLGIMFAVTGLGWALGLERTEWFWIGLCITLVIMAELFNTAIETVVDLVMPNPHPLAKIAKDTAAGAVLIAAVFAVIVGVILLGIPIWKLLVN